MYFLGLDIGTTGCKSMILTEGGQMIAFRYAEYRSLRHPRPGWSELCPDEIWGSVVEAIRKSIKSKNVEPEDIKAIGVSALGGSVMPVDKKGRWLYPCIQFYDTRATQQMQTVERQIGRDVYFKLTGFSTPYLAGLPIFTIMWIRDKMRRIYDKTSTFLGAGEYVISKLSGITITDNSLASNFGAFKPLAKAWSSEVLKVARIDENLMPETKPSGTIIGETDISIKKKTGIPNETCIVMGGWDVACANLGSGSIKQGLLSDVTGTVENLSCTVPESLVQRLTPEHELFYQCHVIPDKYVVCGEVETAGSILRWFRDNFAAEELARAKRTGKDVYDILMKNASRTIGSKKLLVLSDFRGGSNLGAFVGLSIHHGKAEILRAILEGITFQARNIVEDRFGKAGFKVTEIRSTGGGAKSRLWLQMKANILKKTVVAPFLPQSSALGAAVLASLGTRTYHTADEALKRMLKFKVKCEPERGPARLYDTYYTVHKELCRSLAVPFLDLANI
jgi:xylulokinase